MHIRRQISHATSSIYTTEFSVESIHPYRIHTMVRYVAGQDIKRMHSLIDDVNQDIEVDPQYNIAMAQSVCTMYILILLIF